ncbi:hypothetical protein PTSG_11100 [Salpingoeca rosetta]|uniref:Uncharacterized protein n=1 Tax=Salpingoeca rosetta (strain ATCC 50818 / BSB-021) TaxID=946362 RepID=F2US52_SALR5|nr:uncharacterized protein PTSG_11100 [Salpingoeca rosetta]EGD80457.1 hypothetical protein PTSG_11100 [Salpingoeca rosetta]|eukprot:XP_004988021.1 hypothetical protein PTSG_11100 [Salpingoeca rosetta]
MLRASAVLLVLAAVLAVAASTANAVVEPPIWQPAAVYLTIYDNDKCDSSKILVQRNVTTFGSCIRVGTYNSIRVDRDLLQPSSTLSTGYYSSTYCSSTSSSGDVALNGTCTKLSNGRSAQFETTFMIAPVTTYSNCDYDGIWLQPGSYSDLSVRAQ